MAAGVGWEARQPLGLVVVGGLLFSRLVTLFLTPVFYTYMAALQERVQGWKRGKKVAAETPVAEWQPDNSRITAG